jgi:hypothetical protein
MLLAPFLFLLTACSPDLYDSGSASPIERLDLACGTAAVTAVALSPHGRGWVACGEKLLATTDAGRSFAPDAPAPGARIGRLLLDPDGSLLACGRELDGPGLLWIRPHGDWTLLLEESEVAGLGPCEQVVRTPDGRLAVSGASSVGLALQGSDGAWHQPEVWVAAPTPPRVYDLVGSAGGLAAVGADLVGPPAFLASASPQQPLPLVPTVPDPALAGELWSLATPDEGATWLAGGRDLGDDDAPSAVLLRSADHGATWRPVPLPPGLGWVRTLAFAPDGRCGLAAGQRQARAEGGFLLVSCDHWASWAEVLVSAPPLRAAAALDEGFLVGGEGGYLGKGWWP